MTNPSLPEAYLLRKKTLEERSRREDRQSIAALRKRLKENDREPDLYIRLAGLHEGSGRFRKSLAILKKGLARCAPNERLYRAVIGALVRGNRTGKALQLATRAKEVFPGNLVFSLKECLLLPVLYRSRFQIQSYRKRFSLGLKTLIEGLSLGTPEALHDAQYAIHRHGNFLLPYQGCDDRELQQQYGQFVHKIVAANYPTWVEPLKMPPIPQDGRIRVGYVSTFFRRHSVSKSHLGWLQEQNRSQFEVFAYHIGTITDAVTDQARRTSDHFFHLPQDLEQVCRVILASNLHIVIFLDVGMEPLMMQLAALRLAPIQCLTWGHPVTSGLPTVDYFLSSELMEPEDGQNYYSEDLIRLPGIGICYRKPVIPSILLSKSRSDFGLQENRRVYLCCQSSSKYLPQHDDLFPEIAKRIPAAQFVFLAPNEAVKRDFEGRLNRAFAGKGLSGVDHCVVLTECSTLEYWNLNLVCDVFLDSLEWSGCNSTLEAIACGLPIVTLPGRFMRGRHSYAILTQLGVTDTIGMDKADYIDIAVRLGRDREWREQIVQRMAERYSFLYSDASCVRALEEFYRKVVQDQLRTQE